MPLLYLDTNVIMDFLLDRYPASTKLIEDAIACHHRIAISDLTVIELSKHGLASEAANFIRWLKVNDKVQLHTISMRDRAEATLCTGTHYQDALHKVSAMQCRADALVTRNIRDFTCFTDIAIRRPDDI